MTRDGILGKINERLKGARLFIPAGMAELADAHGSGPCGSNTMRVQVSFPARSNPARFTGLFFIYEIVDALVGVDGYGNQNGGSYRYHEKPGGFGFLHKTEYKCKHIQSDKSGSRYQRKNPFKHHFAPCIVLKFFQQTV